MGVTRARAPESVVAPLSLTTYAVPGMGMQTRSLGLASTHWGAPIRSPHSGARAASAGHEGHRPSTGPKGALAPGPQHLCLWPHLAPKEVGV